LLTIGRLKQQMTVHSETIRRGLANPFWRHGSEATANLYIATALAAVN
jgi:hypothetical protein